MNKLLLTFWLCLTVTFCHALDLEKHWWYDFEGKLGNMDIVLSLYVDDDGKLLGNYCYRKYEQKIQISGRISGQKTELTETADGKASGYFSGRIFTDKLDRFEGRWTDATRTKSYDFKLTLRSAGYGSAQRHYPDTGTDDEVEGFMKQVRDAILNGDKAWLAARIRYPLSTTLDGSRNIVIKNSRQFSDNFGRIVHTAYKEQVRGFCICNLFGNYRGVMLGNGQIWINNTARGLRVTAINNAR